MDNLKSYRFSPGSLGLAAALLDLLGTDRVSPGVWPGPCYADVTSDELEALKDLLKPHNIVITQV